MPESTDGSYAVKQELGRRINMWNSLLAAGGPKLAQPTLLRELGIYGGGQSIWVNKQRTGSLTATNRPRAAIYLRSKPPRLLAR
jgi:hypothetical protein